MRAELRDFPPARPVRHTRGMSRAHLEPRVDQSPVRIRPEVLALPSYVPGRSMPGAVKLSSNENPYPPLDVVRAAGAAALAQANRYPDLGARALIAAIARYHGVGAANVCVSTGSSAVLIHALTAVCTPGSEVVYAWRSFESYPIAVPTVGAKPVPVPLTSESRHDLAAMARAITERTAAVILCSPNNPTGPAIRAGELQAFLEAVPERVLVILDEAYMDFVTDPEARSGLELLDRFPNLLVLRTFSKAYSLAGLRVGYGVADSRLVAAVRAVTTPFAVSGVAQAMATTALEHRGELEARVRLIISERDRVAAALRAHGYAVPDTQANFVWIPEAQSGDALVAACAAQRIVVRQFPQGVRVSVGTPEQNDRFLSVALAREVARV